MVMELRSKLNHYYECIHDIDFEDIDVKKLEGGCWTFAHSYKYVLSGIITHVLLDYYYGRPNLDPSKYSRTQRYVLYRLMKAIGFNFTMQKVDAVLTDFRETFNIDSVCPYENEFFEWPHRYTFYFDPDDGFMD